MGELENQSIDILYINLLKMIMDNVVDIRQGIPGSIPSRVNFLVEVFLGFSSTVRQMSGNLGHIHARASYDHRLPSNYSSVYERRRSLT